MSDPTYRRGRGKRWLTPFPHHVIDAALEVWFSEGVRFDQAEVTRFELTSGSVEYRFEVNNAPRGAFIIRAMTASYSALSVKAVDAETLKTLARLAQDFQAWHNKEMEAVLSQEFAAIGPRRRAGPRRLDVNEWAREAYAAGQTIDDILPEYARRRRMNLTEARELLRKAVQSKRKQSSE